MTQLTSVVISGFRGFTSEVAFNLDADVVVLAGPNGSGKTSFFDSILWALSGGLPRFADRKPDVVSLYSPNGHARVELHLRDMAGQSVTVIRSLTMGEEPKVTVTTPSEQLEGASADTFILQRLWPAALQTQDSRAAFCTAFTRSVYLQQDLVRQFIESDTDETRFAVLSELVGAARLSEFLRALEASRNAWSKRRNEHERAVVEIEARIRDISARLERLQAPDDAGDIDARWASWWNNVQELRLGSAPPALGSVEAPQALSEAIGAIQAERRAIERRSREAAELLEEWTARIPPSEAPDASVEELRRAQAALASELETKRQELASAQAAASKALQELTVQREKDEETRALAALALRQIDGDTCPVCGQPHEPQNTRNRLEAILQHEGAPTPEGEPLADLAREVGETEARLAESVLAIRRAERDVAERQAWQTDLTVRLGDLGLEPDATPADLDTLLAALNAREQLLGRLFKEGEQLSLLLARSAEASQRVELEQQLASARQTLEERRKLLDSHDRARNVANEILEAGGKAARAAVDARMQDIQPLVERIYARMDPHPAFRSIRLDTSYPRGRGRVQALVADPTEDRLDDKDPYTLFSSSQLNALAVAIFLGLNLAAADAPLEVAMMDDPLQSLDDVNLLGLVDTLRRTKALRQLILSTHDRRLASLLERKLRPVGDDRATRVYGFEGWTPHEGPVVVCNEVVGEPEEIRVAVA